MKTQSVRLGIAKEENLEELSKLINSAYRGEEAKQGWTTESDLLGGQRTDPESLKTLFKKPATAFITLQFQNSDEIIACALVEQLDTRCYLGMITVRPDLQNRGIGKLLIKEAERLANQMACHELEITVISKRHELIAWYERHGFQKTGKTKPFPYGNERFGIPKCDDLYFEILKKPVVLEVPDQVPPIPL